MRIDSIVITGNISAYSHIFVLYYIYFIICNHGAYVISKKVLLLHATRRRPKSMESSASCNLTRMVT